MSDWYVVATQQSGIVLNMRIVAGPLTKEIATEEARLRLKRVPEGFKFAVVEFDALFALTKKPRS